MPMGGYAPFGQIHAPTSSAIPQTENLAISFAALKSKSSLLLFRKPPELPSTNARGIAADDPKN